ncbi:MAG: penicillin-binding protein activator LpoB [Endomicrobia bacterium]|nr:penicillin-binding protein activator LpoB [Endomicrobiia bacterium]
MKKFAVYFIAGVFVFGLFACSGKKVTRVGMEPEIDLSGQWNDTDSRMVSAEMIQDSLSRPWIDDFVQKHGRRPVIIAGDVLNRTDEHINTQTFVRDVEVAFTNSGRVTMVASSAQREAIRAERDDQARNAAAETVNRQGRESGADFMIQGQINSIRDQARGTQVIFYQVELELISIANNQRVWIGQKQIRKVIANRRFRT